MWADLGDASVLYLASREVSQERIHGIVHDTTPEAIYLNSFFDTLFTARVLLARRLSRLPPARLILAPRGEFSAGALALKAPRKRAYIAALKAGGLLRNIEWHASTSHEAEEIEAALGKATAGRIHVAPDLGALPNPNDLSNWQPRNPGAPLRVCFLARVSPMKNLAGAVRSLAKMKTPAVFTLYGPKEDAAYWAECRRAIGDLPSHITFEDGGVLTRDRIYGALAQHDVFFLPTLGENYGHVIPEALSVGLPVVISDRTPWRGLAAKGVGYDGPLDEDAFAAELDRLAGLDADAMTDMRSACRDYAQAVLTDPAAIEANRKLFLR
ncbi:glycosyltransferase family 4 protein [Mesorhizobium sp. YIM 152430]|uniref:glycosyltransferase family 4 protein n=1 Tax=Mesorhizobium sp. YIM 152430 TaxID=3031761 RepID=UPI0023DABDA9|nr:glycosyltransferase family 4 protein [Mesorhizobium sp. YIM 152430]MDF1598903.1 glycosyltransferase family 4 protein [Mesorhizobium sp. YIM 152430]